MDVDLLRPGTVPISPETVLWFEFLLNDNLLLKHLQKPSCDPSAVELIQMFFNAICETVKNEPRAYIDVDGNEHIPENLENSQTKLSLKNLALKILSLKVAAYIKWNISVIKSLPFKTQVNLLQDLLYFTNEKVFIEIPKVSDCDVETIPEQYLFALLIYHRWLLRTAMHNITPNSCFRNNTIMPDPNEEISVTTPENINKSLLFLRDALTWKRIPKLLTYECFPTLKEDTGDIQMNWLAAIPITKDELLCQLHFDLGSFYFYKENYELATGHFVECKRLVEKVTKGSFCNGLDEADLEGYLIACSAGAAVRPSLLQRMRTCVANHYTGLISILLQDNVCREIPISYRIVLELDIQGALSSGTFTVARDFFPKIQALNLVRCVLDKKPSCQYSKLTPQNVDMFLWALNSTWKQFTKDQKDTIKSYCLQSILNKEIPDFMKKITDIGLRELFDNKDQQFIAKATPHVQVPSILLNSDWASIQHTGKRNPKLEIKAIEQQIITSYNHQEIRNLLVKASTKNLSRSVWVMNPKWELPIPLRNVLHSLPNGFLQDFGYVMLAKSRELLLSKDWESSLQLLEVLNNELQTGTGNVIAKLSQLVTWEMLLVKICRLLEEWPANQLDKQNLADECESCLQTTESILPRTEVMEYCAIALLNLGRWDFLAAFDKRRQFFEINSAVALSCRDFVKYKGNKKVSKDIWDLVLPVFGSPPLQSKRSSNGPNLVHHDLPANTNKSVLMSVLTRLRDSTALTIVISMLTRLYNVLRDESTLELQVDFIMLWPAVVSNANSYNTRAVCEILKQVLTQALYYYPSNIPWLRLMGDINFANGHNEAALNYYLKSLSIATDYFNLPVRNDDHVFRRMIKSCNALGCNTQAAVLCQFLEEPDYVTAFHILAEQKLCNDAVDAYYHCFFDVSILEYLVHLHHKKGEYQRRKRAVQVIGLLEINSNNNEEIQREACNLRKSTFLRALCKQFLY